MPSPSDPPTADPTAETAVAPTGAGDGSVESGEGSAASLRASGPCATSPTRNPDTPSREATHSTERDPMEATARNPTDPADDHPPLAIGFYELLQLPPTATADQLRQSFRRLSKRYHPDTTNLPAPAAARAFQRLKRAYSVLSDPQARRLYDDSLRRPVGAVPPAAAPIRPAPASLRRALSGGEWFALLLLAVALLLSLVLGIGVAWARGAELVTWPSWWTELHPTALPLVTPSPQAAGPGHEDGIVGRPQSSPLTAAASHDDAL
ncbi:MAG: J domain-containing protein [Cyanobacteriota bacterium]|nr:J domain-containing protein [Cyanobacteriota bacterium]